MYFPEKRRLGNICFFLDDVWGLMWDESAWYRSIMPNSLLNIITTCLRCQVVDELQSIFNAIVLKYFSEADYFA